MHDVMPQKPIQLARNHAQDGQVRADWNQLLRQKRQNSCPPDGGGQWLQSEIVVVIVVIVVVVIVIQVQSLHSHRSPNLYYEMLLYLNLQ